MFVITPSNVRGFEQYLGIIVDDEICNKGMHVTQHTCLLWWYRTL